MKPNTSNNDEHLTYCSECNGEDIASICIWCHKGAIADAKDKGYAKALDDVGKIIEKNQTKLCRDIINCREKFPCMLIDSFADLNKDIKEIIPQQEIAKLAKDKEK